MLRFVPIGVYCQEGHYYGFLLPCLNMDGQLPPELKNDILKEKFDLLTRIADQEARLRDVSNVLDHTNAHLAYIRGSKFLKLRDFYIRVQWALHCPLKFLRKYLWRSLPTYPQVYWGIHHPRKLFHKYFTKKQSSGYTFSHHEMNFFNTCVELTHYLSKEIPHISRQSHNKSVLIETRRVPHLEFLIKNTIQKLGNGWGHIVFCGVHNYEQVRFVCSKISEDIEVVILEQEIRTKNDFNNLMLSLSFWEKVSAEKVLIYQSDTFIARAIPQEFLVYDWIGAPVIPAHWKHQGVSAIATRIQQDGHGVGNGGFSLRNVKKIKKVLEHIVLIKNDGAYPSDYLPEDIHFVEMFLRNGWNVARYAQAKKFAFEYLFTDAIGCHQPWLALGGFTRDYMRSRITSHKKVLFINHEETATGAPRVLKDMVRTLHTSKWYEVFTVSLAAGDTLWHEAFHHQWGSVPGTSTKEKVDFLNKVINIDLVIANTIESVPLGSLFKSIPRIAYIHERGLLKLREEYMKYLTHYTEVWGVCNDTIQILLKHGINAKEMEYPLDLPYDNFLNTWKEEYVLGIGSIIDQRKGLDRFLELASLMPHQKFVWIGSSVGSRALEDLLVFDSGEIIQVPSNVQFVGVRPAHEVTREWIPKAKALIVVSYDDPFPIVVTEAKVLNKKVVVLKDAGDAYRICDKNDLVLDHYNAPKIVDYLSTITPNAHHLNHGLINRFRNNIKNVTNRIDAVLKIERIPRIIHQMWKDNNIPSELEPVVRSVKENHPNYEYLFWTDETIMGFISKEYPEILFFYTQLPYPIQRSDLARLLILFHYGGVYVDLDMYIEKPLDSLLKGRCFLGYEKPNSSFENIPIISNALIGSEKQGRFITQCVDTIIEYIRTKNIPEDRYILESTGPILMNRVYQEFFEYDHVNIYPHDYFFPLTQEEIEQHGDVQTVTASIKGSGSFGVHLFFGSWWKKGVIPKPMIQVHSSKLLEYPLVSCVMISKNNAKIVQHAVNAFHRQTYPNKELIIVYQHGISASVSWLRSLESETISVFGLPTSTILGACRNFANTVAKGDFIMGWDDDDYYHQDRITKTLAMMYDKSSAVMSRRNVAGFLKSGIIARGQDRPWEGSIIFKKSITNYTHYSEKDKGEDSDFVMMLPDYKLVKTGYLYLYNYHGGQVNVWNEEHHLEVVDHVINYKGSEVVTAYYEGDYEQLDRLLEEVEPEPFFSVVIATYNREECLKKLLLQLRKQYYKNFEIIIVDQSKTPIDIQEFSDLSVIIIQSNKLGAAHNRNIGARAAKGTIIAFTDDDCQPDVDWLWNAEKYLRNTGIVGIEGLIVSEKIDEKKMRTVSNVGFEGVGFLTANLMVRKKIFDTVGGFDEVFDHPSFREDSDLAWRVLEQGRVPFAADVRVFHPPHDRSLDRESQESRDSYFEKDAVLMMKHPDHYKELFIAESNYKKPGFIKPFLRGLATHQVRLGKFYFDALKEYHQNILKVSVIMGVYLGEYPGAASSRESKFCRAVDSFLSQDYDNKELVIIGDACPISEKIYQEKYAQYKNIIFLNMDKKQMLYSGELRNKGLSLATGDVVCYLDSDDFLGSKHLSSIIDQYNPDNDWFYWDDHIVSSFKNFKNFKSLQRLSEFKEGALGTSCFGHIKNTSVHWESGYGHDWRVIQKLAKLPHQKIFNTAYYVGHIYDALGSQKIVLDN